ncbi:hypothetical protein [Paenibacillus sp. 1781tsa1]|nr:hypothetical protein [Paenibacillus sp. 1781tsa1]MCP1183713.1 hypothetical protein [Paenibacillus sp. 1781tsa1]
MWVEEVGAAYTSYPRIGPDGPLFTRGSSEKWGSGEQHCEPNRIAVGS